MLWYMQCLRYDEQARGTDPWTQAALAQPDMPDELRRLLRFPCAAPTIIEEHAAQAIRAWMDAHPLADEQGNHLPPTVRVFSHEEDRAARTLAVEPYVASTGRTFTLTLYRFTDALPPVWTYTDEEGVGPGISALALGVQPGADGRDSVINLIEQVERIRVATSDLPLTLDRASYEAACTRAGIPAMTDAEIRRASYELHYGEYSMPQYTVDQVIQMMLAALRLAALEQDDSARLVRQTPTEEVE